MRIPARPPDVNAIGKTLLENPDSLRKVLLAEMGSDHGSKIRPSGTKLRHLPPPVGLSHDEWWYALKMRRMGYARSIPLRDQNGVHFYVFDRPIRFPKACTSSTFPPAGNVQMPEPVTNRDTRDRYIVRSLIEEAITSSQLEGAATTREVAKEMLRQGRPPRDRSEKMILNNYLTMRRITSLQGESLSKDLVFEIHRMVTMGTLDDLSAAGRFRRPDEHVAVLDPTDEVLHEPPTADQLESRMDSMCDFANGDSSHEFIHPVIRAMILHFWLAYDHPFVDGNGEDGQGVVLLVDAPCEVLALRVHLDFRDHPQGPREVREGFPLHRDGTRMI